MLKKPAGRVISIDSYRRGGDEPPPEPQAIGPKKQFFGNQGTDAAVGRMFRVWSRATAQLLRIPQVSVEQRVSDVLLEERYKRAA